MKEGVIAANNTAMEFDAHPQGVLHAATRRSGCTASGTSAPYAFPTYGMPKEEEAFFKDWGWMAAPPPEKGGSPGSLTHPIVYVVAADAADPELAVRLLGHASSPTSTPTTPSPRRISASGRSSSRIRATRKPGRSPARREFLEITKFLPNNPQFGELNGIIYAAIQGVEIGPAYG